MKFSNAEGNENQLGRRNQMLINDEIQGFIIQNIQRLKFY